MERQTDGLAVSTTQRAVIKQSGDCKEFAHSFWEKNVKWKLQRFAQISRLKQSNSNENRQNKV